MRISLPLLTSLAVVLALPLAAHADTITVATTGMAGAGQVDTNYSLISYSGGTTFGPSGPDAYGVPNSPASGSQPAYYQPTTGLYINTTGDGTSGEPEGAVYDYETTFNLSALDVLSTGVLNFTIAADDTVSIYLNGADVFDGGTYGSATMFTVSSGFVSGTNVLDFDITNTGGGPSGLYAAASGTITSLPAVTSTPEPSSMVLLGTGLFAVAAFGRRKMFQARA